MSEGRKSADLDPDFVLPRLLDDPAMWTWGKGSPIVMG